MVSIRYGDLGLNLTDAVFDELGVYDTESDEYGNVNVSGFLGDGVLNESEIANAGGLAELSDVLKPYGYRLVASEEDPGTYLVKPEMDCPSGQRYIPDGTFAMGSENGDTDEKPVHDVFVSGFCADETEVTNAAFSGWVASARQQTPQPRFVAAETCTTVVTKKEVVAAAYAVAEGMAKNATVDSEKTTCRIKTEDQTPRVETLANNSPSSFDGPTQPVVNVDHKTATAFCAAGRGATLRTTCAPLVATSTAPAAGATMSAFGACRPLGLQRNKPLNTGNLRV